MVYIIDRLRVGLDGVVRQHIRDINRSRDMENIRVRKLTESMVTMAKRVKKIEAALNVDIMKTVQWPTSTEEALADLKKRIKDDTLFTNKLVIYSNFP